MQRQILGFLALIAAISTSAMLLSEGFETPLILSLVTTTFLALHLRLQPKVTPVKTENTVAIKLIDDLNFRLNSRKNEISLLQNQNQELEAQLKTVKSVSAGHDSEDAAVLSFLRILQEKSRLLDFALTDITKLPDTQVGAASRVVHQGLRGILQDSFEIKPIAGEQEGQPLVLAEDFDSTRYRILQQSASAQKPQGVILHRGWEVKKMNLPRTLRRPGEALPSVLAPVEIEAREVLL